MPPDAKEWLANLKAEERKQLEAIMKYLVALGFKCEVKLPEEPPHA